MFACKRRKVFKTHEKYQAGETGGTLSLSLSDSDMPLIFSTEHQGPVETRATSCLPAGWARDIMQNLLALGSICMVLHFVSACKGA